jgi:hypothetical protein
MSPPRGITLISKSMADPSGGATPIARLVVVDRPDRG